MPSILGSLPFAEQGIAELGGRMPKHLTLYSSLKKSGYDTRFYSGFDLKFDNEGIFLQGQGVDLLVGKSSYDKSYVKSPNGPGGLSWGYPDRELFRKTLETESSLPTNRPHLPYIQTVNMHTPYTLPNQEGYLKKLESYFNTLHLTDEQKKDYRNYKDIYSTIIYTDDALRYFFNQYSKLAQFKNTIF